MKLTSIITDDNRHDVDNMFRRACFNVFSHNRDDHGKNFSYLYDEREKRYRLSPVYDLTYSSTYFGEHTTTVDGNGINPREKELLNVALKADLEKKYSIRVIEEIKGKVSNSLGKYLIQ